MRPMRFLLCPIVFGILLTQTIAANDSHGAVHIILPNGEEEVDSGCEEICDDIGGPVAELKPWYLRQNFEYYEDDGDPTDELEAETSWPGQREDFSDYLFR